MASPSSNAAGKVIKRADPSTIHDKFMVGYQAWFTCPGDGPPLDPGHHGWLHWFNYPIPDGGRPNTDLWPDVSSYSQSELFVAPGLKTKAGEDVYLFSSRNAKTVQRHFHWMAEHGVDGAFLQRFAGQCDFIDDNHNEGIFRMRDEIGDRVREAAEREGRVFAIMYDVSGVAPDRIQLILERDWLHLIRDKGILDSPNYLKEKGKAVVTLWGFGFDNSGHTPGSVRAIANFFRSATPGGAYIMAGTPAHWRTAESDADRNPEFLDVWLNEFDAISPWTIGRYGNEQEADDFAETKMKGDVELIKKRNEEGIYRRIDYIPVVLPGGSGYNLSEGKWDFNGIKRQGGRFLWRQIFNARRLGARIMYGAMWDEYDEGTAFMPVVPYKRLLPVSDKYPFLALDEDGYDLPSDWYMRICGFAAEALRGERRVYDSFPSKELQDYWSTRPKYEDVDPKSGDFVSGSSSGAGSSSGDGGSSSQSYQEWLAQQRESKEEPPPPPYSLEEDEATAATAQPTTTTSSSASAAAAPAEGSEPATRSEPPVVNTPTTGSSAGVTNFAGVVGAGVAGATVASLTNDFARHGISASPQGSSAVTPNQSQPPYGGSGQSGGPPSSHRPDYGGPSTYGAPSTSSPPPMGQQQPGYGVNNSYGGQPARPQQATYGGSSGPTSPTNSSYLSQQRTDAGAAASPPPLHPANPAAQQIRYGEPSAQHNVGAATSPPLHPAHPAAQQTPYGGAGFGRTQSLTHARPTTAQPPPQAAQQPIRPTTAGGRPHHSQSTYSNTTAPTSIPPLPTQAPTNQHGSWSQGQWPPADWRVNNNDSHAASGPLTSSYEAPVTGAVGGASLSRPHTFTASNVGGSSGASLRPNATLGSRPSSTNLRPTATAPATPTTPPGGYQPPPGKAPYSAPSSAYPAPGGSSGYAPSGSSSYNPPGGPSYAPGGPSNYAPPPGPSAPSGYSPPAPSSYPSASPPSSYVPTRPSYGPPVGGPSFPPGPGGPSFPSASAYSPMSSYPGGPAFPGTGGPPFDPDKKGSTWSTFPGQSAYRPAQGSYGPAQGPQFPGASFPNASPMQFPQGPGGEGGFFGMPNPSSDYNLSYHNPSYSQPSTPPVHGAGPWMHAQSGPPPIPPRPSNSNYAPYAQPGPSYPSTSSSGSGAFDFALSAVDKVAGRKARDQLETGVGSVVQSGSKLFNKLTK